MDLKEKILNRAYRFNNERKQKVYHIYDILNDMKEFKDLDYWDAKGSEGDFDRWCDYKGYGAIDPEGNIRNHSNIWFVEQKQDIKEGKWFSPEYCSFVDMFCDTIYFPQINIMEDYLHGDEYDELDFDDLLKRAKEEDMEQYGKEDYRTHLATELKNLFDETICITACD